MNKLEAMQKARKEKKPIAMPPLENGVIVVYTPEGANHNFASQENVACFMEKWYKKYSPENQKK